MNTPLRRALALLLGLALLFAAPEVDAQTGVGCGAPIGRWAAMCRSIAAVEVTPEVCVQGRVIVRASVDGAEAIRVEIGPAEGNAFVREGALALSPIGDFPDWSLTPPTHRRALDGLRVCVRSNAALDGRAREGLAALRDRAWSPSRPVWPWRLLVGLAIALALSLSSARRSPRRALRPALAAVLVALVTGVVHRALTPAALFHQNGQGALWVRYALGEPSPYGNGYFEVFSRVASSATNPEAALFAAQSVAVAVAVACLWLTLRASGVRPLLAVVGAAIVGAEPALARMARSESYAGTCFALVTAALAMAVCGARAGRVRSWPFAASMVAAGLLVAQAARIHPVCWVPAALIPVAVFVGVGGRGRRLRLGVASAALIGLVVVVTTGHAMLDVLTGSLGQQWLPALFALQTARSKLVVALAAAGLLAVVAGWRWPLVGRVGCALVIVALGVSTTVEGPAPVWVYHSVGLLFAPALVVAALSSLRPLMRVRRVEALCTALLAMVVLGVWTTHRHAWTVVPTDALEAARVVRWRTTLPDRAAITYLERAGHEVFILPLYARRTGARVRAWVPSEEATSAPTLRAGDYYYRSSVCSTAGGRRWCDALEGAHVLRAVDVSSLPAIPSVRNARYDGASVRVGLYRVEGAR